MSDSNVFIKRRNRKEGAYPIGPTRGLVQTVGDIGIEIEVEGKNLPGVAFSSACLPSAWVYHQDGSLRGEENAEYVLRQPIPFEEVSSVLSSLWALFEEKQSVIDDSNRTSVHVHLNVQKFHTNRLVSLLALYIIFEEVLTEWCGDTRVGNLFCLRAKDAPAILKRIQEYAQKDFRGQLHDGLHYSGMNLNALGKYGSLEFRSLRGCKDKETIIQWCRILQRLYEVSADFKDPREIIYLFSAEGPVGFYQSILGDCWDIVFEGISFTEQQVRSSMYEGIRLAQDICYCRNWSTFEPMVLKEDPFKRDPSLSMNSIQQATADLEAFLDEFLPTQGVPFEVGDQPEEFYEEDMDDFED